MDGAGSDGDVAGQRESVVPADGRQLGRDSHEPLAECHRSVAHERCVVVGRGGAEQAGSGRRGMRRRGGRRQQRGGVLRRRHRAQLGLRLRRHRSHHSLQQSGARFTTYLTIYHTIIVSLS